MLGVMGDGVPQDPEKGLRYIFINEGDVYQKPTGEQVSYVTVIDTNNDTVWARAHVHASSQKASSTISRFLPHLLAQVLLSHSKPAPSAPSLYLQY